LGKGGFPRGHELQGRKMRHKHNFMAKKSKRGKNQVEADSIKRKSLTFKEVVRGIVERRAND